MRIDAYGASAAELIRSLSASGANTTKSRTADANTEQVSNEDTTSFGSDYITVQTLTDAAFDRSSRSAKITSLQQSVQSGQYTVDPANIAAALSKAKY